jgi:Zonular occludens toxin (Zot).
MQILIAIGAVLALIFFPTLRCALANIPWVVQYCIRDAITYIKRKGWNACRTGELVAYTGLFGKGKTLSAVHRVVTAYRRFDGLPVWCNRRKKMVTQRVKVISNVQLNIPYEEFVGLLQLVEVQKIFETYDDENDTLTCTLVLGDEFSVQMNSRKFKENIDPLVLNSILTCRHHSMSIFYTSQRFGHVDALLRQVTAYVVECDKLWRFQRQSIFDAWDMENATTSAAIRPLRRSCWFVKDSDYNAYDTFATVGNLVKAVKDGDMLTEAEILALQRGPEPNMEAVGRPSRRWLKRKGGKR